MELSSVHWRYRPHQAGNIVVFLSCFTLVTIPWAVWVYLRTRHTEYRIEGEKLYVRQGIWHVREKEVHLSRIKLLRVQQSIGSWLGISTIIVETHNDLLPVVKIEGVQNASQLENHILRLIEHQRELSVPQVHDP